MRTRRVERHACVLSGQMSIIEEGEAAMTTFKEAIENHGERMYQCDSCSESFPARKLDLVDPTRINVISVVGNKFQYVNNKGDIVFTSEQPRSENGDKVYSCPSCRAQHWFGFCLAPNPKVVDPGHGVGGFHG